MSVFVLGVVGMVYLAYATQKSPCINFYQQLVASLSAAAIGWAIPGFLKLAFRIPGLGVIQAGGTIAIFVLVWLVAPSMTPPECSKPPEPSFSLIIRFVDDASTSMRGNGWAYFIDNTTVSFSINEENGEARIDRLDRKLAGTKVALALRSPGLLFEKTGKNRAEFDLHGTEPLTVHVRHMPQEVLAVDAGSQPPRPSRPPFFFEYAPGTPEDFMRTLSAENGLIPLRALFKPCHVRLKVQSNETLFNVWGRCICEKNEGLDVSVARLESIGLDAVPSSAARETLSGLSKLGRTGMRCP